MSFASEMKMELLSLPLKLNCCRKAYLFGLLYNSLHNEGICMTATFGMPESAERAAELLGDGAKVSITEISHAGRRLWKLTFSSKAFASFDLRLSEGEDISSAAKFRCADCMTCFIRGVLISCATVNDPKKSYHLEISMLSQNEKRLEALSRLFEELELIPRINRRGEKKSVYFKSNTAISDILSYAGAMRSSFEVANTCIERDIRNNENRATNCVARNISKSVDAVRKQLAAINKLIERHRFDALSPELRDTAKLRLENDDVSLSELALLHDPPISKSGLNHRLKKICEAAEDLDD